MRDLYWDDENRMLANKAAMRFLEVYEPGKEMKGLYFYGSFGVGKTYILGAIANALANKRVSSMIIYLPEFLREIKNSIKDNTVEEKIDAVKRVQVLMLDDIGAEGVSSFVRDDVLSPILQFRMLERLPTFFTSNFDFDELEDHFTYTQRGEEERVKAKRLLEQIKYLAHPIEVTGENRRHK